MEFNITVSCDPEVGSQGSWCPWVQLQSVRDISRFY